MEELTKGAQLYKRLGLDFKKEGEEELRLARLTLLNRVSRARKVIANYIALPWKPLLTL